MRSRYLSTFAACASIVLLFFVAGCAAKKKHLPAATSAPRPLGEERGIASWYGNPYHGRRAANGEVYDMEKLTAAHRTLPFGTFVEVRNLDNGNSVTVRVTDRGPFVDGRIIDLSKAAAREIDLIGPGIANVHLKIVSEPPDLAQTSHYSVQVGAFQDRTRAENLRAKYAEEYGSARLILRGGDPMMWRVLVGDETTLDRANELRSRLRDEGQRGFVVSLDDPSTLSPQ